MNDGFRFPAPGVNRDRDGANSRARKFDGAHESRTLVRQPGSTASLPRVRCQARQGPGALTNGVNTRSAAAGAVSKSAIRHLPVPSRAPSPDSGAPKPRFPARFSRQNTVIRMNGAPGRIRTRGPQIRSLVLYPAELPVLWGGRTYASRAAKASNPLARPIFLSIPRLAGPAGTGGTHLGLCL